MLVTNGMITRNIAPGQLAEYMGKGYKPVEEKKPLEEKPKAKKGK